MLFNFAGPLLLWPIKKFPVPKDHDKTIIESSIIIEHLMVNHPSKIKLIPSGIDTALKVRFMDRFFDNYVMAPMQKLVTDRTRAEGDHDVKGVADAKATLDVAYEWLQKELSPQGWAVNSAFSLADCAAAPALFYADWVHPISSQFPIVRAYRVQLLARPSIARTVDEARPYRNLFPLGAPEQD